MPDLWPQDIATTELTPPVTLLKEQGTLLGEKTKNLVVGKVVRLDDWPWASPSDFVYSFYIVGPALGNYRYKLLTVSYPPEFYPLDIDVDEDILAEQGTFKALRQVLEPRAVEERAFQANSEEGSKQMIPGAAPFALIPPVGRFHAKSEGDFKQILSAIFGAAKTRRVIAAIIAQSTS
jgi:hypothetical protein